MGDSHLIYKSESSESDSESEVERKAEKKAKEKEKEEADKKSAEDSELKQLKEELEKVEDLEKFLRPLFSRLMSTTQNVEEFAKSLCEKEGIVQEELDKCMAETDDFSRNCIIFRAVTKRKASDALIDALKSSGNDAVLDIIRSKFRPPDPDGNPNDEKSEENSSGQKSPSLSKRVTFNHDVKDENNEKPPVRAEDFAKFMANIEGKNSASKKVELPPEKRAVIILTTRKGQTSRVHSSRYKSRRPHVQILRNNNLKELGESNLDGVLLRLGVAVGAGEKESRNLFNALDSHPETPWAILRFLRLHLDSASRNRESGQRSIMKKGAILDLYVDTETLNAVQWKLLMGLLWRIDCRYLLENLWLDNVQEMEFLEGNSTFQMAEKLKEAQSKTAFPMLKMYIWSANSDWSFSKKELSNMIFWKLPDLPISAPELEKCSYQILDKLDSGCGFYYLNLKDLDVSSRLDGLDPDSYEYSFNSGSVSSKTVTFFYNFSGELMKGLVDDCTIAAGTSVHHLYYSGVHHLNTTGISGENLTRLFIFAFEQGNRSLCSDVWSDLAKFRWLEKLELFSSWDWTAELQSLGLLKELTYVFLGKAKVGSGGWPVETYPWLPKIEKVVLHKCKFETAKTHLLNRQDYRIQSVFLTRNPTTGAGQIKTQTPAAAPSTGSENKTEPLNIALFTEDLLNTSLYEFFS